MTRELDVTTPDGRHLEGVVTGPEDGDLLVFHHGTPGAGVVYPNLAQAAADRGLRTLFYSRPGYGTSTPQDGRRVGDVQTDTEHLIDSLGVDRYWAFGWSGGGPHALACAALAPQRCRGVAAIASPAPYAGQDGGLEARWVEGMGEANVEEFDAAAAGSQALDAFLAEVDRAEFTREAVLADLETLLSPVDVAAFDGALADYMVEGMQQGLFRSTAGWRDDDLAFMTPWGFDVGSIDVPVCLAYGDEDRMVPGQHGDWLTTHLPRADVLHEPGEGHLSLMSDPGRVLDRLLSL